MKRSSSTIERVSVVLTEKIGTPASLIGHTIFFVGMFLLPFIGVDFEEMMLLLTTIVSLEAIYLALFIQMTVNRTSEHIEDVGEDIKEIEQDIDEIQEEDEEEDRHDENVATLLHSIERKLNQLQKDVDALKGTK
ncbi:DUF1003 domain-containing protein [Patescibacteria group bacterium]|mgnify:CR=1 FL=1|nr:DUF1003 domain-containing protein [Patescibacteria group bacterium]